MNNLFKKIATAFVGIAMAVGMSVAVSSNSNNTKSAHASTGSATISGGTVDGTGASATITWNIASSNITVISRSGGGNAVANTNRLYRYNYMEFTATNNYTITSLEITYDGTYRGANNAGGTAVTNNRISAGQSNVTVVDSNVSGGKITVTPDNTANTHFYFQNAATGETNTQLRWKEFKINYAFETSDPSVAFSNPTDIVGAGSSVTNAATGENLGTATISYSSDNTDVAAVNSATGEVTGISVGSATITAAVTINNVEYKDTYTITVTSSANAYYSVGQAKDAIDAGKGLTNQYVRGIVYQVDSFDENHKSITYWISDDGSSSTPLQVYSGKGIGGADFSSVDDVKVGDIVVVKGELKKHNSTYEFNYNNELISQSNVASIAIKTAPSKVAYQEGELFNPEGLVVTATYNDNAATTMDFAYVDLTTAFTFDPTTSTALTNQTSVSISLFGKSTSQAITVTGRTITSVTITGDMTNKTYVKNAKWDFTGLSLTVAYDSGEPTVIAINDFLKTLSESNDIILDHGKADGTNSLTISGKYDGVEGTSRIISGIEYVEEVTFTAGTDQGTSGGTSADSMTKYGITISGSSLATTTEQYRVYANSTLTISSSGDKIIKIEFTDAGDSDKPASNIELKEGETGTYAELVWSGSDDSVSFTTSTQARVSEIKVTVGNDEPAPTPTVPATPTPVEPTPTTPVDPTPVEPTPTTPVDPTPVDPTPTTPVDPTPVDPTPTTPVTPTPTVDYLPISGGEAVTVNQKDGVKIGGKGTSGTASITVPAGTTELSFYAADWNKGENNTLTIESQGVSFNPSVVNLTADTGVANNTPFTLAGQESAYKFTINLSAITSEKAITLTSGSRCVIWAATCDNTAAPYVPVDPTPVDPTPTTPATPTPTPTPTVQPTPTTPASEVELINGSNSTSVTVNEKEAIKVGTGSAGGNMKIKVPAGTTKITFYAAAWNKTTGTVITFSGITANPSSFTLTADSNIKGTTTAFTLAEAESTYKFETVTTNVAAETQITVAGPEAGGKQFVIWGVSVSKDAQPTPVTPTPTTDPTVQPTTPTVDPTITPTTDPTVQPTPTVEPTTPSTPTPVDPTTTPTVQPTPTPSTQPTGGDKKVSKVEIILTNKVVNQGEELKITVRVHYEDGTFEDVATGYTVEGFDSSKVGTQTVTVKYGDKSATVKVVVMDKLGCAGSVVASSAIISLTTLLGAGLLMLKKKKIK